MSRPIEVRVDTVIDRPAITVWNVVSDYRLDPLWRGGVETMGPDPYGPTVPSTTTREVLRFGGRTYRSEGVVVSLEPGRSFAWRTTSGTTASGSRTVRELDDDHCRLELRLRVVPRRSERLMVPILRRLLHRALRTDLERLAQHIDDLTCTGPDDPSLVRDT